MATLVVLGSVVVLRIFTLLALAASLLVMGLNNFTIFGFKFYFTKFLAYRYVFACAAVGFVYTLIQIPFSIYNVVKEKRWIRNGCLQEFDFYGDKAVAFLLASGVGAGFGLTCELRRHSHEMIDQMKKFLNMGLISTGILLAGFVSMALLSIFSSNRHATSGARTIFK